MPLELHLFHFIFNFLILELFSRQFLGLVNLKLRVGLLDSFFENICFRRISQADVHLSIFNRWNAQKLLLNILLSFQHNVKLIDALQILNAYFVNLFLDVVTRFKAQLLLDIIEALVLRVYIITVLFKAPQLGFDIDMLLLLLLRIIPFQPLWLRLYKT